MRSRAPIESQYELSRLRTTRSICCLAQNQPIAVKPGLHVSGTQGSLLTRRWSGRDSNLWSLFEISTPRVGSNEREFAWRVAERRSSQSGTEGSNPASSTGETARTGLLSLAHDNRTSASSRQCWEAGRSRWFPSLPKATLWISPNCRSRCILRYERRPLHHCRANLRA
jgi:hypothetical protein